MPEKIENTPEMNTQLLALLEQINRENVRQNEQLRHQLRLTRRVSFFCACLAAVSVLACAMLLPKTTALLTRADGILVELQSTAETVNESVPATLEAVNGLIAQSRTGIATTLTDVQTALLKLNSLDIDSLNEAITDLAGIVRPLANLLGK